MVKKGANRSKYSLKKSHFNWCKKDVLDTYAIKDGSSSKGNASRARSDERTAFSRAPARGRAVGNSTLGKNFSWCSEFFQDILLKMLL